MPHILVVEDDAATRDLLAQYLGDYKFQVSLAATAAEGERQLTEEVVDLVVLDLNLPDGDGLALARKLRDNSSIPIVILTGRADEVDRVVGLELGADDYVSKPFSPRELTARVRTVLRRVARSGAAPAPPARVPFTVDDERRSIAFFGTPLELSRYEYRVLKLLVSRPGRVFSRDEILQQAWDEPEASFDRTVDAHIKQLRAKLKAVAPDVEAIRTHRGEGYSLSEHW